MTPAGCGRGGATDGAPRPRRRLRLAAPRALAAAILSAAALTVAPPASAADPLQEARRLHERGVEGDREAVIRCVALLEARLAQHPGDAVARAWLGSALTLRARDLGIGPAKLEMLKRGCRTMDEAVAASDEPEARLVRAVNSARLPALFGRRTLARSDFEWLLARARDRARPLPAPLAQAIFLQAGEFHGREGNRAEARAAWEEGLRIDPGTALARSLRERLEGRGGS